MHIFSRVTVCTEGLKMADLSVLHWHIRDMSPPGVKWQQDNQKWEMMLRHNPCSLGDAVVQRTKILTCWAVDLCVSSQTVTITTEYVSVFACQTDHGDLAQGNTSQCQVLSNMTPCCTEWWWFLGPSWTQMITSGESLYYWGGNKIGCWTGPWSEYRMSP